LADDAAAIRQKRISDSVKGTSRLARKKSVPSTSLL